MPITVDVDRLREDLEDQYGTAMFRNFPMAMMDLEEISSLLDYELCEYAQKNEGDLRKYSV